MFHVACAFSDMPVTCVGKDMAQMTWTYIITNKTTSGKSFDVSGVYEIHRCQIQWTQLSSTCWMIIAMEAKLPAGGTLGAGNP